MEMARMCDHPIRKAFQLMLTVNLSNLQQSRHLGRVRLSPFIDVFFNLFGFFHETRSFRLTIPFAHVLWCCIYLETGSSKTLSLSPSGHILETSSKPDISFLKSGPKILIVLLRLLHV